MKKTLEHLLTPIRLGWHGAAVSVVGSYSISEGEYFPGMVILCSGIAYWMDALRSYIRTNRSIEKHGKLDQRIVEPQLTWYCNRQGARTATANHELADEFDRIMSNYKGLMLLRSIPHI